MTTPTPAKSKLKTPTMALRRVVLDDDGAPAAPPYEDWPRGALYERARSTVGRGADDLSRTGLIRVLRDR